MKQQQQKQSKLDSFFKVSITPSTSKKSFIYCSSICEAWFDYQPAEGDTYITCKEGIRLYYRQTNYATRPVPIVNSPPIFVPLLKSNLQKAIRRMDTEAALTTALMLLELDPVELIRRLPIIYIEDVCLIDSLPVLIWLMMVDKEYKLTNNDKWNILSIVRNLCEVEQFYPNIIKENKEFNFNMLEKYPHGDLLLSIYYRSLYGGMKGDMAMLETSIQYYIDNPDKIVKQTKYSPMNLTIDPVVRIIDEAIDFHPYPKMLRLIMTNMLNDFDLPDEVDGELVKKYIWFCQSAINFRKPETIDKSNTMKKDELWEIILEYLPNVRKLLLEE